jgi:hypothetical protein
VARAARTCKVPRRRVVGPSRQVGPSHHLTPSWLISVAKRPEGRILTPTKPKTPLDLRRGGIADSGRESSD